MKTFICGIGKIQNDFEYMFSEMEIEGYFLSPYQEQSGGRYRIDKEVLPFADIQNYVAEDMHIIICDRKKDEILTVLLGWGYEHGKNVFLADDFFGQLDFGFEQALKEKKIAIWGTGARAQEIMQELISKDSDLSDRIECFIDNFPKSETLFGKLVRKPDEVDFKDKFVIVASVYYMEIRIQLSGYGLREYKDFIDSYSLKNPSDMLRRTIYDIPLVDNHCMWPFEKVNIQPYGIFPCSWPSWLPVSIGHCTDDLKQAWNSNILKVIRLSILNHTYSFCDKSVCPYLEHDPVYDESYVFDRTKGYAAEKPEYPKHVAVSFDESCNLRCPSCRPQWYCSHTEEKTKSLEEAGARLRDSEWIEHSEIIGIAGNGEVFYSKAYKEIIFSPEVSGKVIILQTNGTLVKREYVDELVKKFQRVEFAVSIDAASAKTFQKLRTGSWEALSKGLSIISEYRKKNLIQHVRLSFVVQRDNYHEMIDFIKMAKGYEFDNIYFTRLQNFAGWEEDEFWKKSMIRKDGTMREELIEVFKNPLINDEIVDVRQFYRNLELSGYPQLITNYHETDFII